MKIKIIRDNSLKKKEANIEKRNTRKKKKIKH